MSPAAVERLPWIDWERPWLAPYRALGRRVEAELQLGARLPEALNLVAGRKPPMLGGKALAFVGAEERSQHETYEGFIARTGRVPTRDNLHDLFNGLVWLRYASMKARLIELHAAEIARRGPGAPRGRSRDALTLFDENGAVWAAPGVLLDALQRRDWEELFVRHADLWRDAEPVLVGHALLEKLTRPRKAITAHVWVVPEVVGPDVDRFLLEPPDEAWLAVRPHLAFPVLGLPRWWSANRIPGFYADSDVFRPAPSPRPARNT